MRGKPGSHKYLSYKDLCWEDKKKVVREKQQGRVVLLRDLCKTCQDKYWRNKSRKDAKKNIAPAHDVESKVGVVEIAQEYRKIRNVLRSKIKKTQETLKEYFKEEARLNRILKGAPRGGRKVRDASE